MNILIFYFSGPFVYQGNIMLNLRRYFLPEFKKEVKTVIIFYKN